MTKARAHTTERGFVLLVVLWAMILFGLIAGQLASRAHGEASLALAARASAELESAADGGVKAAIFCLLARRCDADAAPRDVLFGAITLTTTIANEGGLVNPNLCPHVLTIALLHVLGLDPQTANELATAMLMWRTRREAVLPQYQRAGLNYGPSGAPFQTIDEIGLVLGMTPALLARLRPHLSLFQQGDVDIRYADPVVARALREVGSEATPLAAFHVTLDDTLVLVSVQARATGGRLFKRTAEIRLFAHPDAGAAQYAILSWDSE